MTNKAGRPKKYNMDSNRKEQILSLIKDYNKNHNPYPTIKYKHIWEYSLELYDKRKFPFKTSYDFWKRKDRVGRQLVDKVNEINSQKNYISKNEKIDLINIKEIIDRYGGQYRDVLWDNLEPYNRHTEEIINKLEKVQTENDELTERLIEKETLIQEFNDTNNKLQRLLFSLFAYSNKDNELINLINTGQSNSKIINFALENTFEDPSRFIRELMEYQYEPLNWLEHKKQSSNIVPFNIDIKTRDNENPEYDL